MRVGKFKDLIVGNSEVVLDQILSDGLLKDVPLISNIVGLYNVKTTISDKLFYTKIVSFYDAFSNVNRDAFDEWKKWGGENVDKTEKIASALILHIDSQNEILKCKLTGHLFKNLIELSLTIEEFENFIHAISMLSVGDLERHCVDGGDISPSHEASLCQRLQFIGFYSFTSESLADKKELEYEITDQGCKFIGIMKSFDW